MCCVELCRHLAASPSCLVLDEMLQSPRSRRLVWASSYRQHACRISAAGSVHAAVKCTTLRTKEYSRSRALGTQLYRLLMGPEKRSFLAGRGASAVEMLRSVPLAPCHGFQRKVCALRESSQVAAIAGVPSLPVARVATEPCLTELALRWSPAREPCTSICQ